MIRRSGASRSCLILLNPRLRSRAPTESLITRITFPEKNALIYTFAALPSVSVDLPSLPVWVRVLRGVAKLPAFFSLVSLHLPHGVAMIQGKKVGYVGYVGSPPRRVEKCQKPKI